MAGLSSDDSPCNYSRTEHSLLGGFLWVEVVFSETHIDLGVLLGEGGLEHVRSVHLSLLLLVMMLQNVSELQDFQLQFIEEGKLRAAKKRRVELLHYLFDLVDDFRGNDLVLWRVALSHLIDLLEFLDDHFLEKLVLLNGIHVAAQCELGGKFVLQKLVHFIHEDGLLSLEVIQQFLQFRYEFFLHFVAPDLVSIEGLDVREVLDDELVDSRDID